MKEDWLPVLGFEGLYEVSNRGRVRSLPRFVTDKNKKRTRFWKGKELRNICTDTGYHFVSLHKNGKRETRRAVHRLIMESFYPREDMDQLIVDHIDGNRTNNDVNNLRWTDYFTNNRNTPYIRYLQKLLIDSGIKYIKEDEFES